MVMSFLAVAVYAQQGPRGGRGGVPPPAGRGAGPAAAPGPRALIADAKPVRSCESLATVALPNTTIESAVDSNGVCRVTAITTHPPAGDKVRIWVAIPTTNWNGRFMGTGGGGFSGGSAEGVNQPAAQGYAAGATDTGHTGGGSFALGADGKLNWQLIRDNGHVGIHEMTVTGKALAQAMYGVEPRYSYFNGCSTGGRQGLMEAQRYPQDYNGIMSGAPAINWNRLHVQQMWGAMLMNVEKNTVPACKLNAATAAAVTACDSIDGVKDGVIEDPNRCAYDPKALIGTTAGDCGAFTEADTNLIRKLWDGPRRKDGGFLWYGLPRGASLTSLWNTGGTPLRPQAFNISLEWFRYFLTQNAQFDWTTLTPELYERFFDQSVEQFGAVIGTDNPDLTEFRNRGGKAIVWHGWADPLISAEGTIDYFKRVTQFMGGAENTSAFIRLFMAPGVGHCSGGAGPAPTGQLNALLAWVEEGKAPETILATRQNQGVTRTRPLCPYPMVARHKGTGSTDDAANFACSAGF
jgi:feruloyl esterase